jgi:hypothetical protein
MSGKTFLLRPGICALLFAAFCLLCTPPLSAAACGGMFSADSYTEQSAERVIFAVNPGQVTLYEQIRYTGSPRDFAWVLPLPSLPTVSTAPIGLFQELDQQTTPRFSLPSPLSCNSGGSGAAATRPASVNVYSSGAVGPYTYQVISSGDPQALNQWLAAHHYHVPAESQAEMQPYIAAHMFFLALRLRGNAGIQDMTPVKITYPSSGSSITIPLRMATPMVQEPLGVQVWIFAAGRYVPQNYQDVQPDYQQVTTTPYARLINQTVGKAGGHGFVTEYAHPTSSLSAGEQTLVTLKQHYRYLTRLYTNLSPAWITQDPSFVAQAGLPDVNAFHQITDTSPAPACFPSPLVIAGGLLGGGLLVVAGVVLWGRRRHAG